MPARTGREFLDGLKAPRDIYVGDEKVTDVAAHPAFRGGAEELAAVFDLQHAKADRCLIPDPETGELINASHMIPRSRDDLFKRHAALEVWAENSVGLMGRTPDYMNVTFAGFAARPDEWSVSGNERGAEHLIAFQKQLRRCDLSLTHTIIHPTVDKALGDAPRPGNDVALHKVGETDTSIIVRGSRILATLAPFADEMSVYPAFPLGEVSAEERVRVFRLGWDFVGSGLASRNEQYERFYLASGARNRQVHENFFDPSRADRLVDQFLTIDTNNDSKGGASCPKAA